MIGRRHSGPRHDAEAGGPESTGFVARVQGRVQAVGFRAWVWTHATRLGLGGYVRNLPDGAVEVGARGAPEALEQLEALLWQGPGHASVRSVSLEWRDVAGPEAFEVRF